MLDQSEFARWLEASDDEGDLARSLVGLGAFNAVVLHAEQASQLALKGLLRGVGAAREAWGHALPELAQRALDTLTSLRAAVVETWEGLLAADDSDHQTGMDGP